MRQDQDRDGGPASTLVVKLLVAGALVLAVVFVFGLLPRFAAPPVVTTDPSNRDTVDPPPASLAISPSASAATATPDAAPSRPASAPPAEAVTPPPDHPSRAVAPPGPRAGAPQDPASDGNEDAGWTAAVSEGMSALERGAFPEAREAFARAEAARPRSTAVKDGLRSVEAGEKAAALAEHRRRALAAEVREDWSGALVEYDAAQKLDPASAFAVKGRERVVPRQTLDERIEGYLRRADRLSSEAVAREAESTLDRASEVAEAGPRLRRQKAALRQALEAAQTKVPVRLLSDGLTQVTVLRVGPLGSFKEKSLELLPGAYVVVGTRKGYRDARVPLEVPAGRSPEPLRVRCEEAL